MSSLRQVVDDIRYKRLGAISTGFYPSQTAVAGAFQRVAHLEQSISVPDRFRIDVVSEKVTECLAKRTCASLRRKDWRIVPWVMWQGQNAADTFWFREELFKFITSSNSAQTIRSLVHAYIYYFEQGRESFRRVGQFLKDVALRNQSRLGEIWLAHDRQSDLFDTKLAPSSVANLVLSASDIRLGFRDAGIGSDAIDGGLAKAAFAAAYQMIATNFNKANPDISNNLAIDRLISWGTGEAKSFRYPSLFAAMATTLLEAIDGSKVDKDVQERLVRYFVDKFGDPRLNRAKWYEVSTKALDAALRVLLLATFEDFTRVIDATADAKHWNERRPFWMAYYDIGAIEEAWVAFGPNAVRRARDLEGRYGLLDHANERTHSALVLRIRDLIIVEWSHNGRCRFFDKRPGAWTPELYAMRYDFQQLHHNSDLPNRFLNHMNNWQLRFASRIFTSTNIRHPKYGSGG